MTDRIESLQARVERAERRTRLSMVAGVATVGLVFTLGMTQGDTGEGSTAEVIGGVTIEDGVITVRGLVVHDAEGVPRIQLGDDPEAQRQAAMFGIVVRDGSGAERFGVGVDARDWVVLGMDAAVGVGSPMRDRLALIVGADGSASMRLIDNLTTVPVELFSLPEGGGGVRLHAYDAESSTLSTRAVTFDGETEVTTRSVGGR